MCGNVSRTSPSANGRPTPPSPLAPWHDWQRAVDLGADAERAGGDLRRLGHGADVHEQPDRHQAQRGHGPERDLQPRLGGRHVRRVGLGRRGGGRGGRGLATDRPGRGWRRGRRGGGAGRGRSGGAGASAAGRGVAGVTTEAERGATITRALQQVFGDLGHAPPRYAPRRRASKQRDRDGSPTRVGTRPPALPCGRDATCAQPPEHDTVVPDCTCRRASAGRATCGVIRPARSDEPTTTNDPAERQTPARCSPSTS